MVTTITAGLTTTILARDRELVPGGLAPGGLDVMATMATTESMETMEITATTTRHLSTQ